LESHRKVWNGDEDLAHSKLEALRNENAERMAVMHKLKMRNGAEVKEVRPRILDALTETEEITLKTLQYTFYSLWGLLHPCMNNTSNNNLKSLIKKLTT